MSDQNESDQNENQPVSLVELGYPDTAKEILRRLPHRVLALIWKLTSMQGVVLLGTVGLVWAGRLDSWAWIAISVVVVFGRAGVDLVKELKK